MLLSFQQKEVILEEQGTMLYLLNEKDAKEGAIPLPGIFVILISLLSICSDNAYFWLKIKSKSKLSPFEKQYFSP